MKQRRICRPGVRAGYDRWAARYDDTPNPLVAMDRRHTLGFLSPQPRERILDAACGTGTHLRTMARAGSRPVGLDISRAMLMVARRKQPGAPLVQADLERELPLRRRSVDAILCGLVGEHLGDPRVFFRSAHRTLRAGGRLVFSTFHPELAAAGVEANFEEGGVEYRLGAFRHTAADFLEAMAGAGFRRIEHQEFHGDARLVERVPWAEKYVGKPLLLVLKGWRGE